METVRSGYIDTDPHINSHSRPHVPLHYESYEPVITPTPSISSTSISKPAKANSLNISIKLNNIDESTRKALELISLMERAKVLAGEVNTLAKNLSVSVIQ